MRCVLTALLWGSALATAQTDQGGARQEKTWSVHFQQTTIAQADLPFHSPYEGKNSLVPNDSVHYSVTATLFVGCRLWEGGSIYLNPELSGGSGLSGTSGVAGFPNGETYRIGSTAPAVEISRLFLREDIALGASSDREQCADGENQIAGTIPAHRITVTAGRFSIVDIFDNNRYSHDARTQFMNWALMSAGSWDFPADTRGYTWGIALEYVRPDWSLRASTVMVPKVANGLAMDPNVTKAHSETFELEIPFALLSGPGTARLEYFHTIAHMGNYRLATDDTSYQLDITQTRAYGRTKNGLTLNIEQQVGKSLGAFMRAGWNDGKNETWAFTEIDHSLSGGVLLENPFGEVPAGAVGTAIAVNGISSEHRDYLAHGGYGFIIGDGRLNYALEIVSETFLRIEVNSFLGLSGDYQFILNPGYNRDRGPVHAFAFRVHIEP